MRLGVFGFNPHPWQSVDRTRRFYWQALATTYALQPLDDAADAWPDPLPDAVLNFAGPRGWRWEQHPHCVLLFALHGGVVLNQAFLRQQLARLETTDVLIVNCRSDIAALRGIFQGATPFLCQLPLPVDPTHFQPLDRHTCRADLPIAGCDYVVGFVARLLPQKNLHHFLYMLAELRRRLYPRTVGAIVIGDYWVDYPVLPYMTGTYRDWIGAQLRQLNLSDDLAYFPAQLGDAALAICYSAMDVLIHPTTSIDENFGYVPVEAMACGTPVVGAAYGGLKDTIVAGETGWLMPTWITQSGIRMDLMRGIDDVVRLLTDGQLRARMAAAAVHRVRTHYTFAGCARRLTDAVEQAVRARQAGDAAPLRLAEPPPDPPHAAFLPPIREPWEQFAPVVAHYVSGNTPTPHRQARLRQAAPLAAHADGSVTLRDPAWPATFQLNSVEQAIVERCAQPVTIAELERSGLADPAVLQHLIDLGLLLCGEGVG